MARTIVITGGKGGVGKTTITVNLGYALASLNKRVVIIDGDIGLNNLDVVMGIENKIIYDIVDVVENKCRPKTALIQDFNVQNLYIFPSNHSGISVDITCNKMKSIIDDLSNTFDFILIDCPAGLDKGFIRATYSANEAIVVTTPHISAVRDCDKTITRLLGLGINQISLIVNRARGDLIVDGDMLDIKSIIQYLHTNIVGVIPEDDSVNLQLLVGGAIAINCEVNKSVRLIAENLLGISTEIFDPTKKYKGFWGNIRKNIKRRV